MNDITPLAKKADDMEATLRESDARTTRSDAPATRVNLVAPPDNIPALGDFARGEETRLRDLLAFAMAVEAGKPMAADTVPDLHRKAEADLQAHAFRALHNQAETIRREAVAEQIARTPRGPSFPGMVIATVLGLALAGVLVALAFRFAPPDLVAQLLALLTPRS